MKQKHICETLLEYAFFLKIGDISQLPGIWEHKVDEHWTIKCNGHKEQIDGVPPFCWYIEFNGWPAGVLRVMGDGILCAGAAGNEENLRKAIESKMNVTA